MAKDRVKALANQTQGKIKDGIHVLEDDGVEGRGKDSVKNTARESQVKSKK
jgi:hypothetical protein